MVLGILIAAITAPGLLGSQEAIRQGQSKDKREEHRARRCNLIASCVKPSPRSREIDGRPIVLRNGKLWIETTSEDGEPFGHTYAGYYLPYPDTKYEGIVTTITDVAPIMNWVYIDRETHEAKYGVRADAQPNLTGPFDCTRQDRRLTFDGWEGWCAVEEYEGYWSLYFDVDDDGLKSKVAPGIRVIEIELSRKERKFKKDKDARQQDQTTQRAVDVKEDAPIDQPLKSDPETQRPGVFAEIPPQPEMVRKEEALPKLPPRTPPPAYSVVRDEAMLPTPERSKKGAVDALDDLLALEVQATVPAQRTPPRDRSLSSSAAPQSTTPQSQTRVIPKLNRNSGSKAIAQAQMFEALAAAQKDDHTTRRAPTSKRVSTASSQADSASVYSEEDQRLSRHIRPHSSVSQRAFRAQSRAPTVPTVQLQESKVQIRRGVTSQLSISKPLPKDEQLVDPAVFAASASNNIKPRTQASSSTQRVRSSRIFAARRPGKRVSPRNSARKSLTDTMSSGVSRQRSSTTNRLLRAPAGSSQPVNRTQSGRKTTSTFLRDLEDLVNQEVVPEPQSTICKTPNSGKPVPSKVEQRGDQRQVAMVKQSRKRT